MNPLELWLVLSVFTFMVWIAYTVEDNETYATEDTIMADSLKVQIQSLRTALASSAEREKELRAYLAGCREVRESLTRTVATLEGENNHLRAKVTVQGNQIADWSDNLFK